MCGVYGGVWGVQILYVSRTHSQVSQFVMEIHKTVFRDTIR